MCAAKSSTPHQATRCMHMCEGRSSTPHQATRCRNLSTHAYDHFNRVAHIACGRMPHLRHCQCVGVTSPRGCPCYCTHSPTCCSLLTLPCYCQCVGVTSPGGIGDAPATAPILLCTLPYLLLLPHCFMVLCRPPLLLLPHCFMVLFAVLPSCYCLLADFGLCELLEPGHTHVSKHGDATPFYAAPETLQHNQVGCSSRDPAAQLGRL